MSADQCSKLNLVAAPGATRVWMQRVGGLTALPDLIRQLGGEPGEILAESGLDKKSLGHPDNAVPYAALADLLERAAERTQCPHFGLLAGRICCLADHGVMGSVVRHSGTVGSALDALIVYQHLNSDGGLAFLFTRGDFVDLGYAIYHPATAGASQMQVGSTAAIMNIMTELCGPEWKPYEVLLSHARPRDVTQYRAFFKVVPRFDADYCALRFHSRDLSLRVRGADPESLRHAERRARQTKQPDFIQQVYRGLRRLMLENRHSGNDLAQLLGIHRRTLNRSLKKHNITFQQVLDSVRFDIARDLLSNSESRLDDVAAILGYAAVTPFIRTFRRWSSTTPGQWRAARTVNRDRSSNTRDTQWAA